MRAHHLIATIGAVHAAASTSPTTTRDATLPLATSTIHASTQPTAWVFESKAYAAQVAAAVSSSWNVIHCGGDHDSDGSPCSTATAASVHAVVGRADATNLTLLPNLKLVQSHTYFYTSFEEIPNTASVATAEWWPAHGNAQIAEWVIAAIFEEQYRLTQRADAFRACAFAPTAAADCAPASTATNHTMVSELTIGVLGYGHIGQEVAKRAVGLGATVIATRRHGPFVPPPGSGLKWLSDDNDRLYREADIVVSCVPYNVLGLVNATALSLFKDDSIFIPISAGPVDFEALHKALVQRGPPNGNLRAVLDLWPAGCWRYPNVTCGKPLGQRNWPYADAALAKLHNVLPLPGMAMRDMRFWQASVVSVAENLGRLANGQPLANVVRNSTSSSAREAAPRGPMAADGR